MGKLLCGEERKREIGIFVRMHPSRGGSYQYVEFIFDGFLSCLDQYSITVLYVEEEWEDVLKLKYSTFASRKIIFAYDKIAEEIDSMGFDYLFIPTYGVDMFYELEFKTPMISVIHDMMYYYQPRGSMWTCKESSYLYQGQCRRSIGVFVDSELGKQHCLHVLGHMYKSKLYILPFRIPNYLYEGSAGKVQHKNEKYFFYPAQIFQLKNHLNLLLSAYFLKIKGVEINFIFTGKIERRSHEYKEICELIRVLGLDGQIEFVDYVDGPKMKYLFLNARAMIMPSFAGPTNIPPIEAMFLGCPVAVSDIFAMPDQVGDAGLCFDPRSIRDISKVLEMLWTDDALCKELSLRGREQAKKYSKEIFNQRFSEAVSQMINRHEQENENMKELAELCRRHKHVYLYGAGEIGYLIGYCLQKKYEVQFDGYIVTKKNEGENVLLGVPIHEIYDIQAHLEKAILVLSLDKKYHEEVINGLANMRAPDPYFITERHVVESWTYYTKTH